MAYTYKNFKTKKELKEAVAAWVKFASVEQGLVKPAVYFIPKPVECYQPGLGPDLSNFTGTVCLEGPHYPKPHTWYATAELKDGIVVKVS